MKLYDVQEGKVVSEEISDDKARYLSKNILFNLIYTDPEAFSFFTILDRIAIEKKEKTGNEKKFTFEELCDLYKRYISVNKKDDEIRKCVEKHLDIFLDVGLMSAEWDKVVNWVRVFRVRNEIAKVVSSYMNDHALNVGKALLSVGDEYKDDRMVLQFLLLNLYFPRRKNFSFVSRVLDINTYLAHMSEVIDPDHPRFYILFENELEYTKLWEVFEKISESKIYEPNIRYYHWNKKITIYGLDEWLKNGFCKGCEITQAKIRFVLLISDILEDNDLKDLKARGVCFAPIVNMNLRVSEAKDCCQNFKFRFCKKFKNFLEDKTTSNEEMCLHCFEYNLVLRLTSRFIKEIHEHLGNCIEEIYFDKWKFYENRYSNIYESIREFLSKEVGGINIKKVDIENVDRIKSEFLADKFGKLVLPYALIKIGRLEIDLCDWLCYDVFEKFNPDIIVAIARKGITIIEHLTETEAERYFDQKEYEIGVNITKIKKLFNDFREKLEPIDVVDDDELIWRLKRNREDIIGKKILIFDDAIDEGNKIKSVLGRIREVIGEDWDNFRKNVKLSAYVVNSKNIDKIEKRLKEFGFSKDDLSVRYKV